MTGDDEQGQPPEAPWHHSTPAVAGASAAALAVIGLVVWVAVSLTGSGGPEDAPIDFVPPTYTSTSKTTKSTTTRTTTSPPADDHGVRRAVGHLNHVVLGDLGDVDLGDVADVDDHDNHHHDYD
ncbi:hypothetical protein [Mycolicibacterium fortuitum]